METTDEAMAAQGQAFQVPKVQPTVARTVLYVLTEDDAKRINNRRGANAKADDWPQGAIAHFGNTHHAGQELPLVIVRVWPDEFGPNEPGVNGQVLLDGNDSLWVTSAKEGTEPGTWHWPTRN